jgi:hypothetical protein
MIGAHPMLRSGLTALLRARTLRHRSRNHSRNREVTQRRRVDPQGRLLRRVRTLRQAILPRRAPLLAGEVRTAVEDLVVEETAAAARVVLHPGAADRAHSQFKFVLEPALVQQAHFFCCRHQCLFPPTTPSAGPGYILQRLNLIR